MRRFIDVWLSVSSAERASDLSFFKGLLFVFLVVCKPFYRALFVINQAWRRLFGGLVVSSCPIVSVGNLSLGGTGKSVFCQFLAKEFRVGCALVCRGYGGSRNRLQEGLLVSDGSGPLVSASVCGDEAHMFARLTRGHVVAGSSRYEAVRLLHKVCGGSVPRLIVLDDAYQNHELRKNCEILLVDARRPLGNGHYFPAGQLREKDLSRADIIVLTHADKAASTCMDELKKAGLSQEQLVVRGRHRPVRIVASSGQICALDDMQSRRVFACAGIGSFDQFLQTVRVAGGVVVGLKSYADHYNYNLDDYREIVSLAKSKSADVIVTTEKDWSKLEIFHKEAVSGAQSIVWYVLQIEFEFLSPEEYGAFKEAVAIRVALH